jgi:hypothetical protein
MKSSNGKKIETRGYAPVNGLKMYYEIEGTGEPLVYIPRLLVMPESMHFRRSEEIAKSLRWTCRVTGERPTFPSARLPLTGTLRM